MQETPVPTIVDILGRDPERLPKWLDDNDRPCFDRKKFFDSRTVYYPGSGTDGQPVELCALSHAAHTFIYVDYGVERDRLDAFVNGREQCFRGYKIAHSEKVSEDALWPGGWTPHVSESDLRRSRNSCVVTWFGWFVVLNRRSDREGHVPRRLAILFIGADGITTYDRLYCQGDGTPPPYLAVIQDAGFGGGFARFDRDGLLDRIAKSTGVLPEFLLVAENSNPWSGYANTGAPAEPGGCWDHERSLYRRVTV